MTDNQLDIDPWAAPGVHTFDDRGFCLVCTKHLLDAPPVCRADADQVAEAIRLGLISGREYLAALKASERPETVRGTAHHENGGTQPSGPPTSAQEVTR